MELSTIYTLPMSLKNIQGSFLLSLMDGKIKISLCEAASLQSPWNHSIGNVCHCTNTTSRSDDEEVNQKQSSNSSSECIHTIINVCIATVV